MLPPMSTATEPGRTIRSRTLISGSARFLTLRYQYRDDRTSPGEMLLKIEVLEGIGV